MTESTFSYAPGVPVYPVPTFSRASIATHVETIPDHALVYWPGALHVNETFVRASVATYLEETTRPTA